MGRKRGNVLWSLASALILVACVSGRPGVLEDLESQIVPVANTTSSPATTAKPGEPSSTVKPPGGNVTVGGSSVGNGTKNGTTVRSF